MKDIPLKVHRGYIHSHGAIFPKKSASICGARNGFPKEILQQLHLARIKKRVEYLQVTRTSQNMD